MTVTSAQTLTLLAGVILLVSLVLIFADIVAPVSIT